MISSYGDCLVTSGTKSNLGEDNEERLGLVAGHCYCIMQVGNLMIMIMKYFYLHNLVTK